jgi:hypothetical protein
MNESAEELATRDEIGHGARRMTPSKRRTLSLAFAGAVVVLFAACSGESEGQRCELTDDPGGPDNTPGGSDCASNLDCFAAGTLGGAAAQYAADQNDPNFGICCPPNRAQATTSICALQPSPPGGDAGFVDASKDSSADSAPLESSTSDSPSDSPTADSPSGDAAADADAAD